MLKVQDWCKKYTLTVHGSKWPLAHSPVASNFPFGRVTISEVNGILALLAQTILDFLSILLFLDEWRHILSV